MLKRPKVAQLIVSSVLIILFISCQQDKTHSPLISESGIFPDSVWFEYQEKEPAFTTLDIMELYGMQAQMMV